MKRLLLITISVALAACSPQKRLTTAEVRVDEKVLTQTDVSSEQKTVTDAQGKLSGQETSNVELTEGEQVVTEVVEFDTSLPADSTTGTSPIKRKTTQTRSRTTQVKGETTTQQHTESSVLSRQETTVEKSESSDTALNADTKVADETRRGMTWIQKTLCIIGAVVLLYMIVRLCIRTRF